MTGEWNEPELIGTVRRVVVTWCNGPENIALRTRIEQAHGIAPDRIDPTWLPHMLLVALEWEFRVQIPLPITATLTDLIKHVMQQPYPEEDVEDMLEWSTKVIEPLEPL
jgi:hypothetical protein